jgi:phosphoribulokinase
MNFHWIYHGSGSENTRKYVEQVNKLHALVWKRAPGTFSQAWDAQSAIILLSCYEALLRKMFGAKNDIHP